MGSGFRVRGLGLRGSGFRVRGLGFRGSGFRVRGLRVRGLGLKQDISTDSTAPQVRNMA